MANQFTTAPSSRNTTTAAITNSSGLIGLLGIDETRSSSPDDKSTDRSPSNSPSLLFSLSSLSSPSTPNSPLHTSVPSSTTFTRSSSPSQVSRSPSRSPSSSSSSSSSSRVKTLFLFIFDLLSSLWATVYSILQIIIINLFTRPLQHTTTDEPLSNPLGRIAIIGAGISGISTAAHFLTHGFEVVIFEQADSIGGIWAKVNSTSSLQLDSLMYRFHPSVKWSNQFPVKKAEILLQLRNVWENYRLQSRTRFNVTVEHVARQENSPGQSSKWTINDGAEGVFDAIVVAVGTCGPPRRIRLEGRQKFEGQMVHSCELDQVDWNGKRVTVIGGGASAVEAVECAVQSGCATPVVLVTRTDKWFIPRNVVLGSILASNPLGFTSFLDPIAERMIRKFHYGPDLQWMSPAAYDGKPADRLYSKTPIVNYKFLELVREKRVDYVRAKVSKVITRGMEIQRFSRQKSEVVPADVIVEATGYDRPRLDFLPAHKLFKGSKGLNQYAPPNLFIQNFAVNDWSCLMTNAAYYEGIGTVGHTHIGILARMLMMFLLDSKTAPSPSEMTSWVDRMVKLKGSLTFFTYSELSTWLTVFLLSNPRRWSWLMFVGLGWGNLSPAKYKVL